MEKATSILTTTDRLKLVDNQNETLKMVNGRFCLRRDQAAQCREHFIRWYFSRGKDWLPSKANEYCSRMEVHPAGVKVQALGYRWGSCGKGNWLYFN